MSPAVMVPLDACPHRWVAADVEYCPSDTTAPPGIGAPQPVSGEAVPGWLAPAPTYRVTVPPPLVTTTDAGPGGTIPRSVAAVPVTLTWPAEIIRSPRYRQRTSQPLA